MPFYESNLVAGLQWGNEGKSQIVDFLLHSADVVARFQGCSNDVRTLSSNGVTYDFSYLPSGFSIPGLKTLICGGVTLDLERFVTELEIARTNGFLKSNLIVSKACHLILDHHKKLDVLDGRAFSHAQNRTLDDMGLGYCCADKYRRVGIRVSDLLDKDTLYKKIERTLHFKNIVFERLHGEKGLDPAQQCEKYWNFGKKLAPYIGDSEAVLRDAFRSNLRILFEGTDGTMHDVDAGPYPYVLPLSSVSGSAFLSFGGPQRMPLRVIGVAKAYSVCGGSGPFIAEERGAVAPFIRNRGREFSKITGQPHRIGWLDLPALKYAINRNGADVLALTNLGVLTGIDEIKICIGYRVAGKDYFEYDITPEEMAAAEPLYRIFPGWREEISDRVHFYDLPQQAQQYVRYIEETMDKPVLCVGVGSNWGETLFNIR
ncbi:adenylosuccinate synthetase [Synergistaceae bacterium OttesenSCG-928-D05]|nr:adenylosuccinate synthetase [Synergistaceae bacterium OttesenSCG-928-D05]